MFRISMKGSNTEKLHSQRGRTGCRQRQVAGHPVAIKKDLEILALYLARNFLLGGGVEGHEKGETP